MRRYISVDQSPVYFVDGSAWLTRCLLGVMLAGKSIIENFVNTNECFLQPVSGQGGKPARKIIFPLRPLHITLLVVLLYFVHHDDRNSMPAPL